MPAAPTASMCSTPRASSPTIRRCCRRCGGSSALAQHALALLVGQHAGELGRAPDFKLEEFALPARLPQTLPSELAHRRPDILAAEAQLHAATAAVGVAAANLYPQISLSATASLQANVLHSLFDSNSMAAAD